MFGSGILDVAIGLIFIYFLLAAITSHLSEAISALCGLRGKGLHRGLTSMLGTETADKILEHPAVAGTDGRLRKRSYLSPALFSAVLLDLEAPTPTAPPDTRAAVLMSKTHAPAQAKKRAGYEAWFNDTMDRVSGAYKRRLMFVTLAVGSVLVVLLNVDTLAIATTLSQEQAVRAAVQSAAASSGGATALEDAVNTLGAFALPLGWTVRPSTPGLLALKVLGLATTTFAVWLGAPFWFQVLQMIGRFSGPKPPGSAPSSG